VNISQGRTIFQQLEAVDLKKMKKKEQQDFVAQQLSPMYGDRSAKTSIPGKWMSRVTAGWSPTTTTTVS
jgi:hypothetical protein